MQATCFPSSATLRITRRVIYFSICKHVWKSCIARRRLIRPLTQASAENKSCKRSAAQHPSIRVVRGSEPVSSCNANSCMSSCESRWCLAAVSTFQPQMNGRSSELLHGAVSSRPPHFDGGIWLSSSPSATLYAKCHTRFTPDAAFTVIGRASSSMSLLSRFSE